MPPLNVKPIMPEVTVFAPMSMMAPRPMTSIRSRRRSSQGTKKDHPKWVFVQGWSKASGAYKVKLPPTELRCGQPAVEAKELPANSLRGGPRGTTHIHSSVLYHVITTCRSGPGRATHVGSSTIELRLKIRDRSAIRPLPTLPRYGWTMRGRNVNNSRDQGRDLPETYWSR